MARSARSDVRQIAAVFVESNETTVSQRPAPFAVRRFVGSFC
jgi:hypothetical protein